MTKTFAATQITWFAKATFLKQSNYLHLKIKKVGEKTMINTGFIISELKF